jgi:hypothetical protein
MKCFWKFLITRSEGKYSKFVLAIFLHLFKIFCSQKCRSMIKILVLYIWGFTALFWLIFLKDDRHFGYKQKKS